MANKPSSQGERQLVTMNHVFSSSRKIWAICKYIISLTASLTFFEECFPSEEARKCWSVHKNICLPHIDMTWSRSFTTTNGKNNHKNLKTTLSFSLSEGSLLHQEISKWPEMKKFLLMCCEQSKGHNAQNSPHKSWARHIYPCLLTGTGDENSSSSWVKLHQIASTGKDPSHRAIIYFCLSINSEEGKSLFFISSVEIPPFIESTLAT